MHDEKYTGSLRPPLSLAGLPGPGSNHACCSEPSGAGRDTGKDPHPVRGPPCSGVRFLSVARLVARSGPAPRQSHRPFRAQRRVEPNRQSVLSLTNTEAGATRSKPRCLLPSSTGMRRRLCLLFRSAFGGKASSRAPATCPASPPPVPVPASQAPYGRPPRADALRQQRLQRRPLLVRAISPTHEP